MESYQILHLITLSHWKIYLMVKFLNYLFFLVTSWLIGKQFKKKLLAWYVCCIILICWVEYNVGLAKLSNCNPHPLQFDKNIFHGKILSVIVDVRAKILPGVTHWQSPNFFAYYPSNSSIAGFLGEMLSAGLNIVGFSWITSPAATELEMTVLDWLAKLLKLPDDFLSAGTRFFFFFLISQVRVLYLFCLI